MSELKYFWICPDCDTVNRKDSQSVGTVICEGCGEEFDLSTSEAISLCGGFEK